MGGIVLVTVVVGVLGFALFVLARALAASALRVPQRLRPFGEPALTGLVSAGWNARILVAIAGPLTVYGLATAVCVLVQLGSGQVRRVDVVEVMDVVSGLPAADAGIRNGDRIVGIAGVPLTEVDQFGATVRANPGRTLDVDVQREGKRMSFSVALGAAGTPRARMGVRVGPVETPMSRGEAVRRGLAMPLDTWAAFVKIAFTPADRIEEVSGPIGIWVTTERQGGLSRGLLFYAQERLIPDIVPTLLLASLALLLAGRRAQAAPPPPPVSPLADASEAARPWVRFFARTVDSMLAMVAILVLSDLLRVSAPLILLPLVSIPIEAALLASWGYTPGKWLLGVAVRAADGRRLSFREALHRTGAVTVFGLGGLTEAGLVTPILGYRQLTRDGATYWDKLGGWRVWHRPVGGVRFLIAAIVMVGVAFLLTSL